MNTSLWRALPTAFLFLLTVALTASAQDLDNATISGTVTDANHAAILGASVSLIPTDGGSNRSTATDAEGRFMFISIAPGKYLLRASMPGFEDRASQVFELSSAANLKITLTLRPRTVFAEQTVETDVGEIFTEGARPAVGGSIASQTISELPNARADVLDLALLLGGASEESLSTRDLAEDGDSSPRTTPFEQGLLSLGGGTAYSNNLTIDGLDNNDDRTSRERFLPPIESVSELQIVRNQFSAEYGRASGGRINFMTKSGGKRLRGTLAFSGRDERLNANSWYNNSRGIARPMFREQKTTAFLGGPLCAARCGRTVHFAASYELQRHGDTTLIDTFVPLAGSIRFPFPMPNGTNAFCEAADPHACAGTSPSGAYISSYTSLLATPNTGHAAMLRIDTKPLRHFEIGFSLQLGRRNLQRTSSLTVGRLQEALQTRRISTDAFNLSILTFGRRYANQIRTQWSEFSPRYIGKDAGSPVIVIAYRNPLTGASSSLVAGNSTASTLQNFAESRNERRLQLQDTATFVSGVHIFKFGVDLQSIDSRAKALTDSTGTFNFANMLSFTRGTLSRFRQTFGTRADVRNLYSGAFFNDEVRLADTLNATFGIRYETESAVRDRDNFGPRIAVAWDPLGDGRGVMRAGAGIFYNRVLLRTVGDFARSGGSTLEFDTNLIGTSGADSRRASLLNAISALFPRSFGTAAELRALISSTLCGTTTCPETLGFAALNSASLPLRGIDRNIRIPESRQFNIGYELGIARGVKMGLDFTINSTRRLWREYDANAAVVPMGYSDWTAYLLANPFAFRNSNGNIRTYRFYLGTPTDPNVSTLPGGGGSCSTTASVVCYVNLNSVSTSTTSPSTATADSSNSIGSPIGIAFAAAARFRPDATMDRSDTIASIGRSSYRGLVFDFRMSERPLIFGMRATMRASYTLSSQSDDGLNNTSNAEVNGDFAREWSRGLQDRRHRATLFGTFRLPRSFAGLNISPALRFGSSAAFNIGTGVDRNLDGSSTDRPMFSGDASHIRWRRSGSQFPTDLFSGFSLAPIGSRGGSLGRNAGTGPRLFVFDLNLSKNFKLRERLRARPNLEIGNVLNAAVFSYGAEYIDFTPIGANPTVSQLATRDRFLVPTRAYRPREMRMGMRVEF